MVGKLVVIEGIDGVGKNTALNNIREILAKSSIKYFHQSFPLYDNNDSNVCAEIIQKYLRDEIAEPANKEPMFIASFYAMDRYLYKTTLLEALKRHKLVLLDRFVASNMAYQAARYTKKIEQRKCREQIYHLEHNIMGLPKPDMYILLNGQADAAFRNLKKGRTFLDKNERNQEFMQQVYKQYLAISKKDCTWRTIDIYDAHQDKLKDPKAIAEQIWQEMQNLLRPSHSHK